MPDDFYWTELQTNRIGDFMLALEEQITNFIIFFLKCPRRLKRMR
jgi:hypothetical protein